MRKKKHLCLSDHFKSDHSVEEDEQVYDTVYMRMDRNSYKEVSYKLYSLVKLLEQTQLKQMVKS